jgi:cytochrome c biogenesis protein CcmG, thiol:disulfide interchange protein DsbE
MKKIIGLLALTIFCSFTDQDQSDLPAIELKKLSGASFNTSELTNGGKPILVLVWEISCRPCIQEFDNISKLYSEWQEKTGVKVIAISVDDNRNYNKVSQLVRSKGWPFEFYQDKNQDIRRAMGIQLCPYAFIVNSKREVIWRKSGYSPGDETIIYEQIQKLSSEETTLK